MYEAVSKISLVSMWRVIFVAASSSERSGKQKIGS